MTRSWRATSRLVALLALSILSESPLEVRAAGEAGPPVEPPSPSAPVVEESPESGPSAAPAPAPSAEELVPKAREALARGIARMIDMPPSQIGDVWTAMFVHRWTRDPRVRDYVVRHARTTYARDGALRLLVPSSPRPILPEDPGRGHRRFLYALAAPLADPPGRASALLDEFTAIPEATGYVLSHQFIVLVTAENAGLELPAEVRARRGPLLDAMLAEHRRDPVFTDLYAERAAFLLEFASPDEAEARGWIATILAARRPDGIWKDPTERRDFYDGENILFRAEDAHVTNLSLWALARWLHLQESPRPRG